VDKLNIYIMKNVFLLVHQDIGQMIMLILKYVVFVTIPVVLVSVDKTINVKPVVVIITIT
jgi:hypothetical protein